MSLLLRWRSGQLIDALHCLYCTGSWTVVLSRGAGRVARRASLCPTTGLATELMRQRDMPGEYNLERQRTAQQIFDAVKSA
jgi:hypothetical protein